MSHPQMAFARSTAPLVNDEASVSSSAKPAWPQQPLEAQPRSSSGNAQAPGPEVAGGQIIREAVYQLVVPPWSSWSKTFPKSRVIHPQHHLPVPEKRQSTEYILCDF